MRFLGLLLLLAACAPQEEPGYDCTLLTYAEDFSVGHPYVYCENQLGDRLFFDYQDYLELGPEQEATWTWIREHQLPDEWFDENGIAFPGTPPTIIEDQP